MYLSCDLSPDGCHSKARAAVDHIALALTSGDHLKGLAVLLTLLDSGALSGTHKLGAVASYSCVSNDLSRDGVLRATRSLSNKCHLRSAREAVRSAELSHC